MIEYRTGNLLASGADALVNPVNCLGVSGAGLALAFKRWDMATFAEYRRACHEGRLRPGGALPIVSMARGARVYHVATKDDWRDPSRLEWIEAGAAALARHVSAAPPHTIAIPALGCGHGGLPWEEVRPVLHAAAEKMAAAGARVWVYEPGAER